MSQLVAEDGTFHTYRLSKLRSDDLRRECLERLDLAREDSILSKQINLRDTAQRRVARRCMLRSCDEDCPQYDEARLRDIREGGVGQL